MMLLMKTQKVRYNLECVTLKIKKPILIAM